MYLFIINVIKLVLEDRCTIKIQLNDVPENFRDNNCTYELRGVINFNHGNSKTR